MPTSVKGTSRSAKIEQVTGLKGTYNEKENVLKVGFPRSDVPVTIDGAKLTPFLGLGTWSAFTPESEGQVMMMADTVLFGDEVNPVMSTALENGLQVTALHNHFLFEEPAVYFMHIAGQGGLEEVATGVRRCYDKIKEIRAAHPQPAKTFSGQPLPKESSITAAPLDGILGVKGETKEGMYKAVIGREIEMECGCTAGKDMGVNTWAAFAGSDENAVVDGDFAMAEAEVQDVLKTLRTGGINIVAIHQHMVQTTPTMIFLHYWGRGKAGELAKTLRAAMDTQARDLLTETHR
jgi:hypothetical protein